MKYFFTLILIVFIKTLWFAQKFSTSIDAQLSIPECDYKEVNQDAGYGLRLNLLFQQSYVTPAKFGIEFGIQEKGPVTQYLSGYLGDFYNDFKISEANNIFSLMFLTRFQSSNPHWLNPFPVVTAGWNVFFSTTSIEQLTFYVTIQCPI